MKNTQYRQEKVSTSSSQIFIIDMQVSMYENGM